MKPEDMFERIGEADERYVADAKKKRRRGWIPAGAVAAVLAVAILCGAFLGPWNPAWSVGGETTGRYTPRPVEPNVIYDAEVLEAFSLALAEYPLMAQYPGDEYNPDLHDAWYNDRRAQGAAYSTLEKEPTDFFYAAMETFLANANGENIVCSPVNIYMALAMLAEVTDGNSRREILDALGEESIESLRVTANAVWNAHYNDDGAYTSILGASLWLADSLSYDEETVTRLKEIYYASSFRGEMGSESYNEALRAWLNTQTGGMLSDQISELEMPAETVLALATTVYFRAKWGNTFDEEKNSEGIFHGASGDTLCEFMNSENFHPYYWGERFSAVALDFDIGGSMYFILPDEGVDVSTLLSDKEITDLLTAPSYYEKNKYCEVVLSVPKFDVSSQLNLADGMRSLGITSVFDSAASDFSPITDIEGTAVSEATHGARVAIDEEGCVAAAFTMILDAGGMPPGDTVEFVVDRPFLFVITSEVGTPLFVGVVNVMK